MRFEVKEGAFASIKNDFIKLGTIKDISKGGLAFTYIVDKDRISESFWIDILFRHEDFYLKDVPAKKIFDFYVEEKVLFSSLIQKQVGVQFGDLESHQLDQLNHFINHYTIDGPRTEG